MKIYIPASFNDNDYRPSWTGNNTYPTVTIRGIFDSVEKAITATKGWVHEEDCNILERWLEEDDDWNFKDVGFLAFDIDLSKNYLKIWIEEDGDYPLNKIIDEEYSAVYDENGALGVTDY